MGPSLLIKGKGSIFATILGLEKSLSAINTSFLIILLSISNSACDFGEVLSELPPNITFDREIIGVKLVSWINLSVKLASVQL